MDTCLSFIPTEDLLGILKTILLFLESQNFHETCRILQTECSVLGHPRILPACPKVIIIRPSTSGILKTHTLGSKTHAHKGNQTDCPNLNKDISYTLQSSFHDFTCLSNNPSLIIYYADTEVFPDESFCEIFLQQIPFALKKIVIRNESFNTSKFANCENLEYPKVDTANLNQNILNQHKQKKDDECTAVNILFVDKSVDTEERLFEQITVQIKETDNMSPNVVYFDDLINIDRLEMKTDRFSQTEENDFGRSEKLEVEQQKALPDDDSYPSNRNKTGNEIIYLRDCVNNTDYQDLKIKLAQLQNEHKKLMSVAAELTSALQTNIVGQSENLNSVLNNCREIYPDLFVASDGPSNYSSASQKHPPELFQKSSEVAKIGNSCQDSHSLMSEFSQKTTKSGFMEHTNSNKQELVTSKPKRSSSNTQHAAIKNEFQKLQDSPKPCTEPCNACVSNKSVMYEEEKSTGSTSSEYISEPPNIYITTDNFENARNSIKNNVTVSVGTSKCGAYFELDFKKLKKDLLDSNLDTQLRLLQALRWRITHSNTNVRDHVMSSYIRHDLLGLHSNPPHSYGKTIMESCFRINNTPAEIALQEGYARLVNTFASLTLGRDYLCQNDDILLTVFLPLVKGTHHSQTELEPITRDMILATLQKLSLRNKQRLQMIASDFLEHLISFLSSNHDRVSGYCLEYTTALLMNLCLHKEARDRCRILAAEVVRLLADLLNARHKCCIPYVNGAMYSLLGEPHIRTEARRLELGKLIEYHLKRMHGIGKKQLEYILKLYLHENSENYCDCDGCPESEEEVDLLEAELDQGDSLYTRPAGEELLYHYRLLFPLRGSQVHNAHPNCLCRPVTPIPRSKASHLANNFENRTSDINLKERLANAIEIIHETDHKTLTYDEFNIEAISKETESLLIKNSQLISTPCDAQHVRCDSENLSCETCKCGDGSDTIITDNFHEENNITECKTYKQRKSISEPLSETKEQDESNYSATSRSSTPESSYCEDTKQFYHKPSAKKGIFESKNVKKLHRVPPSFTKTIIETPTKRKTTSNKRDNCVFRRYKSLPVTPKDEEPPNVMIYPNNVNRCYIENYDRQRNFTMTKNELKTNINECNNSTKYMCECYDTIKSYVAKMETESAAPSDNKNVNQCQCDYQNDHDAFDKKIRVTFQNPTSPRRDGFTGDNEYVPNTSNELLENKEMINPYDLPLRNCVQRFQAEKKICKCTDADTECRCCEEVFQSRPKILRTPP